MINRIKKKLRDQIKKLERKRKYYNYIGDSLKYQFVSNEMKGVSWALEMINKQDGN